MGNRIGSNTPLGFVQTQLTKVKLIHFQYTKLKIFLKLLKEGDPQLHTLYQNTNFIYYMIKIKVFLSWKICWEKTNLKKSVKVIYSLIL